jgi:hypothetical protein
MQGLLNKGTDLKLIIDIPYSEIRIPQFKRDGKEIP